MLNSTVVTEATFEASTDGFSICTADVLVNTDYIRTSCVLHRLPPSLFVQCDKMEKLKKKSIAKTRSSFPVCVSSILFRSNINEIN